MNARLLLAGLGCSLVALSCGAENDVAPPAEQRADVMQCQGLDALMPAFVQAISQGRTEGLKHLVETQLLTPLREGDAPPVNDVLRAVFKLLDGFAKLPPEAGAPRGQLCAPTASPPPLATSNGLCEMRRAMDVLVHQGKGIDAINLIEPQLNTALGYITGEGLTCKGAPRTAHYEISAIVAGMCTQDANCQLSNGLDLVIAFAAYVETPDGKTLLDDLNTLASKPSVTGLLDPANISEDQMVSLVRGLLPVIRNADAAALDSAFNLPFIPAEVRADLQPVVNDLKKLLAHQELMTPTRLGLVCFEGKDPNLDLVRMIYRLAIAEDCDEFGLTRLTAALKGVQETDTRGSLIHLVGTLAAAVRADETAIDSAAIVCQKLFEHRCVPAPPEAGAPSRRCGTPADCVLFPDAPACNAEVGVCVACLPSNAQLALPVVADLVRNGVINEGICAIDTLVFGCAGGPQPACQ